MSLTQDLLGQVLSSQGLDALARQTGLSQNQVRQIAGAGLPSILQGVINSAARGGSSATGLEKALLQHGYNYDQNKLNPGYFLNNANVEDGQKILGHVFGAQKSAQLEDYLAKQTGANKKQTGSILGTLAPLALAVLGGKFLVDGGLNKVLGGASAPEDTESHGILGEIASSAKQLFAGDDTTAAPTDASGGLLHSIGSIFGGDTSAPAQPQVQQTNTESPTQLKNGLLSILGLDSADDSSAQAESTDILSQAKSALGADANNNGIPDILEGLQGLFK